MKSQLMAECSTALNIMVLLQSFIQSITDKYTKQHTVTIL